jgi:phosphatidate cytidylyltransferase
MLIARVVTAVALIAGCIGALFLLDNLWWSAALLAVLGGAAWEWGALAGYARRARWIYCGALIATAVALYQMVAAGGAAGLELAVYGAGCVFWILIAPAWLAGRWRTRPWLAAAAGCAALLPAWLCMARLQTAPSLLLQLLGIVWLADTAAFFVGRSWGRHKLAPSISPGKTWEGVAGAAVAVAVYYVALSGAVPARAGTTGWAGALLFGGVMVLSIVGDLLESWLKRQAGVKDSGAVLPGHGGILDRIDGLTAGMPLAALLTRLAG